MNTDPDEIAGVPLALLATSTHAGAAIDGLEACASTVVLVTGASGDVGGHIARCLIDKGYSVSNCPKPITSRVHSN